MPFSHGDRCQIFFFFKFLLFPQPLSSPPLPPSFFFLAFSSLKTFTCPHHWNPGAQGADQVWPHSNNRPKLFMLLLSLRPWARAERPKHPAEAAGARAQRPALTRAPRSSAAAHGRRAWALRAAAHSGAALAYSAAAAEAEPDQPHSETSRPGSCGDSARARI